jgi:lysophospholipase L1-like esterase
VISGLAANGMKATAIPAGISGHRATQMMRRLDRDVLSKKADWMTLSCGVNDVWHGANGVPLEQYKTNITAIVDKCQAAGIKVVILTATVIGEDLGNPNNQKLAAYNDFLRALAKEKNCQLADLNADFQTVLKAAPKPGGVLTGDGVHMNAAGNLVMAKGVLKAFGLDAAQLDGGVFAEVLQGHFPAAVADGVVDLPEPAAPHAALDRVSIKGSIAMFEREGHLRTRPLISYPADPLIRPVGFGVWGLGLASFPKPQTPNPKP